MPTPRKNRVIPPVPPEAEESFTQVEGVLAELSDIAGAKVILSKRESNGEYGYIETMPADACTIEEIAARHGGGRYRAQVRGADGRYIGGATFPIHSQRGATRPSHAETQRDDRTIDAIDRIVARLDAIERGPQAERRERSPLDLAGVAACVTSAAPIVIAAMKMSKSNRSDLGQAIAAVRAINEMKPPEPAAEPVADVIDESMPEGVASAVAEWLPVVKEIASMHKAGQLADVLDLVKSLMKGEARSTVDGEATEVA